jgi:trehalose 6-phosphate phosphatase
MAVELRDIGPLRTVLRHQPLGILSDIDGTLAPIVADPSDAAVAEEIRDLLHDLVARGVRLALISGRPLQAARDIVGIEDAAYAGNHGLEFWIRGKAETPAVVAEYVARARLVLEQVGGLHAAGVLVEDKGPVLAFHYRRAADGEAARRAILSAIEGPAAAQRFLVREGRKVIELLPPLPADKGTAVRSLVRRLGLQAVVCLGDDRTDIDMFRAVADLRTQALDAAIVAVASEEAVPALFAAADYAVAGVEGVAWLLGEVVRELRARAP